MLKGCAFVVAFLVLTACGKEGGASSPASPAADPEQYCDSAVSLYSWNSQITFAKKGCRIIKNGSTIGRWAQSNVDYLSVKIDTATAAEFPIGLTVCRVHLFSSPPTITCGSTVQSELVGHKF